MSENTFKLTVGALTRIMRMRDELIKELNIDATALPIVMVAAMLYEEGFDGVESNYTKRLEFILRDIEYNHKQIAEALNKLAVSITPPSSDSVN